MSTPLLTTKLYLPPRRPNLVPRPRLIERLNDGLCHADGFARKLTLISAPAGYGKTTLVAEWLNRKDKAQGLGDQLWPAAPFLRSSGVAWLSLDEGDNDPTRFLTYFIAALRGIDERIGETARSMLQSAQPPPLELLLTTLINDVVAAAVPIVLAVDDYHVIQSPAVHQQLAFFLDHLLPQMHLVLITREDPLLPIPRLRARGQVLEMRQDDLRFSAGETVDFLGRVMGLTLDPSEVTALENRTEGWITGLQLAALSMQRSDDLKGFVLAFTGSSRFILDYLVQEVFERQTFEVQDFLLKTSILQRLSAPLCDAVLRPEDETTKQIESASHLQPAAAILEHLEQANLFIIPLDQSRVWYRYHHLFAGLLHHRLRASHPDDVPQLHQRASRWFESQALTAEAIQHSLAAQDWERAVRLIDQAADALLKGGELVTLVGWFKKLPGDLIRSLPQLGLSYAWALLLLGSFDEAEELLSLYEEMGQSQPALLGQVATAQAHAARSRDDNQRAIEKSELALRLLPESDVISRSTLSLNLGLVYWHEGDLRAAVPALNDAFELAGKVENHYARLTAQIFLARTLGSQSALLQAEEMLRTSLQVGGRNPILALAHYDLAGIYYEWNDLARAQAHLEQGLELSRRSVNIAFQNAGHILKATLAIAQGNIPAALAAAATSHALARDFGQATKDRCMACHAQVALAAGDVATAEQWVGQMSVDMDVNSFHRFLGLTKARLCLAQGNKAAARKVLAERLARALQTGCGYATIAIYALQARAAESEAAALELLAQALELSQPEGFIRTYVDAGAALIPLLHETARRGKMPDYVGRILGAYDDRKRPAAPPVELLSQRELEVLRLVTAGLSNREIAAKLFISTGTAKTHVHNLCGKLGVRNRTEAATRAKDLKLV